MKYDHKYDNIINLPHHVSKKHPQMSLYERSAQFAPFATLTGYEDAVKETARLTDEKMEIDDEIKNILDSKLHIIIQNLEKKPEITITYFKPDMKKSGGKYVTTTGCIKRIDKYNQFIELYDNTKIPINEIVDITSKILKP